MQWRHIPEQAGDSQSAVLVDISTEEACPTSAHKLLCVFTSSQYRLQGANYRRKAQGKRVTGQVSLVLGAGNQTPVACMDILHKLFAEDAVVVCKMNPVNEYLGKFIR